jgi:hypothetical protein
MKKDSVDKEGNNAIAIAIVGSIILASIFFGAKAEIKRNIPN